MKKTKNLSNSQYRTVSLPYLSALESDGRDGAAAEDGSEPRAQARHRTQRDPLGIAQQRDVLHLGVEAVKPVHA